MSSNDIALDVAGVLAGPGQKRPEPRYRDPYPLGVAMQATFIFAIVGASLGLFVALLSIGQVALAEFFESNALPVFARKSLTLGVLLGAATGGAGSLLFLLLGRRAGVPVLRQAADLAMPLGFAFLLPSLFTAQPWSQRPMVYLVQLVAVVLGFEWTLRRALGAWPRNVAIWFASFYPQSSRLARWLPLAVVVTGSTAYAVYFSYYTILNHQRMGTSGFDLGINVNWCYNALQGQLWRSSVLFGEPGGNFLSGHAIFAMLWYLPLFALKQDAEFFLIFQATMVGFAGTALYLFASTQIPRWSAVVVALAFLMFAPLHGPNFYDYHELLPPLFFQFLLFWAIATNRNRLLFLIIPLLWSFREDIPVGTCVLGLFLLLTGIRQRLGLVLAITSLTWFVVLKFVIMPWTGTWWFASMYKELQPAHTSGYGPVVQTMLINPTYLLKTLLTEDKLIYFLHMMAPVALLPMRRAALLILAIPGFAFSLLTTGYAPTISIAFHYTCHSIPYIFAATVLMLRVLGRGDAGSLRRRAVLGAVALGVLSHSYVFGAVLQHSSFVGGFYKVEFQMTPDEQQRYRSLKRLAAMIPQAASVAASEDIVPHIAARRDAYTLKDGVPVDADYLFLHAKSVKGDGSKSALKTMFDRDQYGLLGKGDDLYLFKRGHESAETSAALSALHIKRSRR